MEIRIKAINNTANWGEKDPNGGFKTKFAVSTDTWIPGLNAKSGMNNVVFKEGVQERLEDELDLDKGTLNRNSDYWSTFKVIIPAKGLTLHTENPMHELILTLMRLDPTVAKSQAEADSKMSCQYVMLEKGAEAKKINKTRDVKARAYARYLEMTVTECINVLKMLGKEADDVDPEVCRQMVGDLVDKNPSKFLTFADDDNIKDKVWLKGLIRKGIVTKAGVGADDKVELYYNGQNLNVGGVGLDKAIAFINMKQNQEILIGLKRSENNK